MDLLGLPHETSRPDRDQYVEINMNNLRTGYSKNIALISASAYLPGVLNLPYDYQSITQYTDDDLAKDQNTWAIRIKTARGASRGQNNQALGGSVFSSGDFDKINAAYGCGSGSGRRSGNSF